MFRAELGFWHDLERDLLRGRDSALSALRATVTSTEVDERLMHVRSELVGCRKWLGSRRRRLRPRPERRPRESRVLLAATRPRTPYRCHLGRTHQYRDVRSKRANVGKRILEGGGDAHHVRMFQLAQARRQSLAVHADSDHNEYGRHLVRTEEATRARTTPHMTAAAARRSDSPSTKNTALLRLAETMLRDRLCQGRGTELCQGRTAC
jgi:hypothetical protein